jgi:hypothetical protein
MITTMPREMWIQFATHMEDRDIVALCQACWTLYNQFTKENQLWEQLLSRFPSPTSDLIYKGYFIPYPENCTKHQLYLWTKDYFNNGYVRALKKYAMPNEKNINDFISHVSNAHSWYKHLPIGDPGHLFYFYLHPTCQLKIDASSKVWKPVLNEDCFHYSTLPTDLYRKKFGILTYSSRLKDINATFIPDTNMNLLLIPPFLIKLSSVYLTALFHGSVYDIQGLQQSFCEFLDSPPEEFQTDVKQEILEFFFSVRNYNQKISQLNAQNLSEVDARTHKEQYWKELIGTLLPNGIPEAHYKEIDTIRKKYMESNSHLRDIRLVAIAEHYREKDIIKERITALVNFILEN